MIARKPASGVALAFALTWPVAALADEGRLVTAADLAGKKICWEDGAVVTFAANGGYSNSIGWRTRWIVSSPGIVEIGPIYREMVVLPDGRFQTHRWRSFFKVGGHDSYRWGRACS